MKRICLVKISPSKHLLVLKTSSTPVLKTSSTRLQRNNFTSSKTYWRRLEDILQDILKTSWRRLGKRQIVTLKTSWRHALRTSWRHVLKTSWRHVLKTSWRHVLKMSWRHVLKTSWRHYGDKQKKYLLGISVSNKSKCVSNKSIFDNSKANPKCIK